MTNLLVDLSNPETLADSLDATVGYLESCEERHETPGRFVAGIKMCQSISLNLRQKEGKPTRSFIEYTEALHGLTELQIEVFDRLKIDYQARIGSVFFPASPDRFLGELTAIIFTIAAHERSILQHGVGSGFGPRFAGVQLMALPFTG